MNKPVLGRPVPTSRWLVYPFQGVRYGLVIAFQLALFYALCQAGWGTVMFWRSPLGVAPQTLVEVMIATIKVFVVFGVAYFTWSGSYGLVFGIVFGLAVGFIRAAGGQSTSARRAFGWGAIAGGIPGALLGGASWPLWTRFAVTPTDYVVAPLVYVLPMALLPALGVGWLCQRVCVSTAFAEESP